MYVVSSGFSTYYCHRRSARCLLVKQRMRDCPPRSILIEITFPCGYHTGELQCGAGVYSFARETGMPIIATARSDRRYDEIVRWRPDDTTHTYILAAIIYPLNESLYHSVSKYKNILCIYISLKRTLCSRTEWHPVPGTGYLVVSFPSTCKTNLSKFAQSSHEVFFHP